MPNAETLKSLSLKQFDSGTQASDIASETVTEILSQLSGSSTHAGEPQKAGTKLVPTGPGLPALPKKMVEKISAGQYIDFSELLLAKGRTRTLPSQEEGHVAVIRAKDLVGSKKLILDLATWLQCFIIYMAVIIDTEPDRAKSLLTYMITIAKQASSTLGRHRLSMTKISDKKPQIMASKIGLRLIRTSMRNASPMQPPAGKAGARYASPLTMGQMLASSGDTATLATN